MSWAYQVIARKAVSRIRKGAARLSLRWFRVIFLVTAYALHLQAESAGEAQGIKLAAEKKYQQAWVYLKDENRSSSSDLQAARAVTAANLGFTAEATQSAAALIENQSATASELLDAGESLGRGTLFAQAENCFTAAQKLEPGSFRAAMDLAATFYAQGRFAEAAAAAEHVAKMQPSSFPAQYLLGSALISSGKTLDGLLALREARKLSPSDVGLLTLMGVEYVKERYFAEAVDVLRAAVAHDPGSERLQLLLISATHSHGSAVQAKDLAKEALKTLSRSARLYMQLGIEEDAIGESDSARQHYSKSIELDPSNPESHYLLGDFLYREGNDYSRAVELFEKAVELAPDFTDAYLRMGSALINLGKYSEAEGALEKGVKTSPDDPRLYARLMACYRKENQQEKLQQALAAFNRLNREDSAGMVPQERPFP